MIELQMRELSPTAARLLRAHVRGCAIDQQSDAFLERQGIEIIRPAAAVSVATHTSPKLKGMIPPMTESAPAILRIDVDD